MIHIISIVLLAIALRGAISGGEDPREYQQQIGDWQRGRLKRLTSETGWLTICGLFWLKEGENTCGTGKDNQVVFPAGKTQAVVGSIWYKKDSLWFQSRNDVPVYANDTLVKSALLKSDLSEDPTVLRVGTISFYVIDRGGKQGVRVKDSQNPLRVHFKGLEYFPVDLRWRVKAKFIPYSPHKKVSVASLANTREDYDCPGALEFMMEGKAWQIDAMIEQGAEDRLFIMFLDNTNGRETYGGGRQMYTPLPDSTNSVILDFNKAYNWPCAFTEFATCPIVPRQNRLPFRVEAGEKVYADHD